MGKTQLNCFSGCQLLFRVSELPNLKTTLEGATLTLPSMPHEATRLDNRSDPITARLAPVLMIASWLSSSNWKIVSTSWVVLTEAFKLDGHGLRGSADFPWHGNVLWLATTDLRCFLPQRCKRLHRFCEKIEPTQTLLTTMASCKNWPC